MGYWEIRTNKSRSNLKSGNIMFSNRILFFANLRILPWQVGKNGGWIGCHLILVDEGQQLNQNHKQARKIFAAMIVNLNDVRHCEIWALFEATANFASTSFVDFKNDLEIIIALMMMEVCYLSILEERFWRSWFSCWRRFPQMNLKRQCLKILLQQLQIWYWRSMYLN